MCGSDGIQIDAFDAAQTQDSATRLTCLYPLIYTFSIVQHLAINPQRSNKSTKKDGINFGKKFQIYLKYMAYDIFQFTV